MERNPLTLLLGGATRRNTPMRLLLLVPLGAVLSCASTSREPLCDFPPIGRRAIRDLSADVLSCADSPSDLRSTSYVECMEELGWSDTPKSACEIPVKKLGPVLNGCYSAVSEAGLATDPFPICSRWVQHEDFTMSIEIRESDE
jgi:hypothetical protein